MTDRQTNILSVDVEDWFHILESDDSPRREEWDRMDSRVEANTDRLLALFDDAGATATFFVVGWVAARHPGLVRRIAEAGHEVASHSFWHEVMGNYDRGSLAADLARSRSLLEDQAGAPVEGFRAPGSSITPDTAWALDVIQEAGFRYDSSLCPGYSSHGGFATPHLGPHRVRCRGGELIEFPNSTLGLGGRRIPYAGGGYLRLLPYSLIRTGIALENRAGRPANVYLHPREIDPDQPRMDLSRLRSFKYYVGVGRTEAKLRRLLSAFRFASIRDWLAASPAELPDLIDLRDAIAAARPDPDPQRVPPPPTLEAQPGG